MAGKIRQQNGATIGCRFGGWKRLGNCKLLYYKSLGAVLASQPARRVLRIVAMVLPPDLGLICRDEPRDGRDNPASLAATP